MGDFDLRGARPLLGQSALGSFTRRLLLGCVGADELRRFYGRQGLDRGEIPSGVLSTLLPPGDLRAGIARLAVPEHLTTNVRALLHLPGNEPLLILPSPDCPLLRRGHARVGVNLVVRHGCGPCLDPCRRLRQGMPSCPPCRLNRAVLLVGGSNRAGGATPAESPSGAECGRCRPHALSCGETSCGVCGGLLDQWCGNLRPHLRGGRLCCGDDRLQLVGLGLLLPQLTTQRARRSLPPGSRAVGAFDLLRQAGAFGVTTTHPRKQRNDTEMMDSAPAPA